MAAAKVKESKNARRRAVKKAKKVETTPTPAETTNSTDQPQSPPKPAADTDFTPNSDTDLAGPVQPMDFDFDFDAPEDPLLAQYKEVLQHFTEGRKEDKALQEPDKGEIFYEEDDVIPDEEAEEQPKLSKKARKQQNKLSIAELKTIVQKPELVEWTDVSAPEPKLLANLKAYRNVVPVPSHWSLKREYLSSKRGIEKPPFALPKFIQDTGIGEMRDAMLEKQEQQTLKQKQRERVQGKLGRLDIDYSKLYEAFFRFQTKPELTRYGEVYYEGKEYETNLRHLRPGELSDELKDALSIPPGAPPPWLVAMQRFGPPPSYPALKIPGLNAPPPPGASWGYHPGGYGKPPVDENGRPLYGGDIYGVAQAQQMQLSAPQDVEKTLWGELQAPEESEEEEEDEEGSEDEEEEAEVEDIGTSLRDRSGLETSGGLASAVPTDFGGVESVAGEFNLRKQRRGTETEEITQPRSAYQVLPEQNIRAQGFFGSERVYDLKGAQQTQNLPVLGQEDNSRKRKVGDVDVSVDVDALERDDRLSKDEVKRQYESRRQEQANPWGTKVDQDDLSQMIADESRKRLKRDEERRTRR